MSKGMAFPPRVGPDGRVAWSSGAQNVRESIQIILQTRFDERIMRPSFGGGLGEFLYEPNTVGTRRRIEERTRRALSSWEPRAAVESVTAEADPDHPDAVILSITYTVRATGAQERLGLTVTLGR